jgi:thiol-disulfide isomerase/thioredoxin
MRAFTICSVFLSLVCEAGRGEGQFETQIKTVTVVDANGVPVPDAHVYRDECLVWDNQAKTARLTEETPWQHTNAKGTFSFEFVRRGAGSLHFVTDASFSRMGSLFITRKDPNESYTVRLEKLARIRGAIRSADAAFSNVHVELLFDSKKDLFPFFSADYRLDASTHELAFDIPCPAGCNLSLRIEGREPAFKAYQGGYRDITALKPGQTFDIGTIELHGTSGFKTFGKPAPELQVAEWVKGKPVTLAELKGKVVLLDFWGLWCGPCRRALPGLTELHRKYAGDGLVIIAVHDASQTGASLLEKSRGLLDLSNLPFRIAVDSPLEGAVASETANGTGRTIAAYGITAFPTGLIINKEGQVEDTQSATEDHIYFLLHGRHMPSPTMFSRLLAGNQRLLATIIAAGSLILVLAMIWGVLRLRRSGLASARRE